jgi:glycine/D-amino acid oxidase-like deaminating enzyme
MPSLAKLRVLAQWAALYEMTPDVSPIIAVTPVEVSSSSRRGTYGSRAGLAAGRGLDHADRMGRTAELIAASGLARFADGRFAGEGAVAVGH